MLAHKATHLAGVLRRTQTAFRKGPTHFHMHRHTCITTYTYTRHIRQRKYSTSKYTPNLTLDQKYHKYTRTLSQTFCFGRLDRTLWSAEQGSDWAEEHHIDGEHAQQLKKTSPRSRARGVDNWETLEMGVQGTPAEILMKSVSRKSWCKKIDGVVLVPTINSLIDKKHYESLPTTASLNSNSITVVRGKNARKHLGGLDQPFRHLKQNYHFLRCLINK